MNIIYIFLIIILMSSCVLNLNVYAKDKYMQKLLIIINVLGIIVMAITIGYYSTNQVLLVKIPIISTLSYCIIYLLTLNHVEYIAPKSEGLSILLAVVISITNAVSIYLNNYMDIFTLLLCIYFITTLVLFIFILAVNMRREKCRK